MTSRADQYADVVIAFLDSAIRDIHPAHPDEWTDHRIACYAAQYALEEWRVYAPRRTNEIDRALTAYRAAADNPDERTPDSLHELLNDLIRAAALARHLRDQG